MASSRLSLPFDWASWRICLRLVLGRALAGEFLPFAVQLFLFLGLSALSLINMVCLALDAILFPGFLQVALLPPLFIVGNARSGTGMMPGFGGRVDPDVVDYDTGGDAIYSRILTPEQIAAVVAYERSR